MELRQLRYFVTVAEELHFGRAAARIGIEQSPLSKAMKDFERELRVKLLLTTTRRTELTNAGQALLEQARQILESVTRAEGNIKQFADGTKGDLTVGLSEGLLNAKFSVVLSQFSMDAPQARIMIEELSFEQQVSALDSGVIELGFAYSSADTATVAASALSEHRLLVAMAHDHVLSLQESLTISDLCREPLILSNSFRAGGAHAQIDALLRSCRSPPVISDAASSVSKLLMLVRAKLGIALLTEAQAEWIGHSDITFRPLSNKRNYLTAYLLHRRDSPSALANRFILMAKAEL